MNIPPLHVPLADRLRPETLADFFGQDHVVGEGKMLRRLIDLDRLASFIFWGPPGVGKTTLARIIAKITKAHFAPHSAVSIGIKEIKQEVQWARERLSLTRIRTILFLDEIHRFNKAQQDVLLPHVENGDIILIGATTENPSFSVIPALLSRCRVIVLKRLEKDALKKVLTRALQELKLKIAPDAEKFLLDLAQGDARAVLIILEIAARQIFPPGPPSLSRRGERVSSITLNHIENAAMSRSMIYDKNGEEHYNVISALHKSLRDSDASASLYWMARMLEAGEDPMYVVRRLVRFASEDIGNADPRALQIAVAAMQTVQLIGMPECNAALSQLVIYLAQAPKDNTAYTAYTAAAEDARKTSNEPVPLHLRNASTKLMKDLGYGRGYKYAHNFKDTKVAQEHLPSKLKNRKYL